MPELTDSSQPTTVRGASEEDCLYPVTPQMLPSAGPYVQPRPLTSAQLRDMLVPKFNPYNFYQHHCPIGSSSHAHQNNCHVTFATPPPSSQRQNPFAFPIQHPPAGLIAYSCTLPRLNSSITQHHQQQHNLASMHNIHQMHQMQAQPHMLQRHSSTLPRQHTTASSSIIRQSSRPITIKTLRAIGHDNNNYTLYNTAYIILVHYRCVDSPPPTAILAYILYHSHTTATSTSSSLRLTGLLIIIISFCFYIV